MVTASLPGLNLAETQRVLYHWSRVFSAPPRLRVSFLDGFLNDGDFLVGKVVEFIDEAVDFLVRGGDLALQSRALVVRLCRVPTAGPTPAPPRPAQRRDGMLPRALTRQVRRIPG